MNIAIPGGAGFIGSHLVEKLVEDNHHVTVIDKSEININRNLSHLLDNPFLEVVEKDVLKLPVTAFKGMHYVVHLAALADIVPSIQDPVTYFENNVTGTLKVLNAAVHSDVKKFIYIASGSCYGNRATTPTLETHAMSPQYPYALTKMMGEELALHWHKVYKLPVTSLRLFNVYGPRSRTTGTYGAVFGTFLAQKINKKPLTVVGDGSQSRDFTYVTDVAEAIYLALTKGKDGEVYNIGSGYHTPIKQLASLIGGPIDYIPDRPGEPRITLAYIAKAQRDLRWAPKVSFNDGVKKMLDNIDYWKDAPVWTSDKIKEATKDWFKYLGGDDASELSGFMPSVQS